MGIFGQSSPFDADIEKATSEKNTTEDWSLIMDVCDKVSSNPRNAKECLKAIMRRMGHNDPHVVIQAITLLDACVNNCGKSFHLEVASRDFETEYRRLLGKTQPEVAKKMRLLLKKWAENDFKNDPQLNLIPSFYHKLKSEGQDFSDHSQKIPKSATQVAALKDPNVVTSQQEEEDIAKAIELSLKEAKNSPKKTSQASASTASAYPSLYPSFSGSSGSLGSVTSATSTSSQPEARKVRALYDFEAAEENELTFVAGEIIHVLDDSDPNWWKGYNQRGEGLFPSNFVTADLSVEPERLELNQKTKKSVQFEDEAKKDDLKTECASDAANYVPEVNEEKIDRLLHLLHEANPEDPSQDSDEMIRLEQEVHQMGPLIDAELERVDRKHAQLTQLSSGLVDAINLYHTLMRDDRIALGTTNGPMGYGSPFNPQQAIFGPPGPGMFANMPNMYHTGPGGVPPMPTHPHMSMPMSPGMHNMQSPISQTTSQPTNTQPQSMPIVTGQNGFNSPLPQQQQPQQQQQQMIPIQYQNGHQGPPQQQQQQQQTQQNPAQPQMQQLHHQPQPHNFPTPETFYQLPQQHQAHPDMFPPPQQTMHSLQNMQQQNMSPQQFPPRPFPNQLPQNFVPGMNPAALAGLPHQQLPGYLPHMAAINQPAQTILGQNDSKTNIPVYQQQR